MIPSGLYIHIPFCAQFCTYCDFYSVKIPLDGDARDIVNTRDSDIADISASDVINTSEDVSGYDIRESYVAALSGEIRFRSLDFNRKSFLVNTIYFGGGTPSVLSATQLEKLLGSIHSHYQVSADPEVTIEVNPDDITESYASNLLNMKPLAVNRVSLGIQSFVDDHLKWMNRRHDSAGAIEAFHILRRAGFCNISIDLIFGFEGLSMEQWRANIRMAISLMPEHISCYQLGIEKGTQLYKSCIAGEYTPVPDEISYEQYSVLQQMLGEAGYIQYEVSSFSLPGKESLHNSSYWNFTPYFGFGPAAHSFDGITRSWNKRGVGRYIAAHTPEDKAASTIDNNIPSTLDNNILSTLDDQAFFTQNSEILSREDISHEFIMLSLRTVRGIDLALAEQYIVDMKEFWEKASELVAGGELLKIDNHLRIPADKLFISDNIIREFF